VCESGWTGADCNVYSSRLASLGRWVDTHADAVFLTTASVCTALCVAYGMLCNMWLRRPSAGQSRAGAGGRGGTSGAAAGAHKKRVQFCPVPDTIPPSPVFRYAFPRPHEDGDDEYDEYGHGAGEGDAHGNDDDNGYGRGDGDDDGDDDGESRDASGSGFLGLSRPDYDDDDDDYVADEEAGGQAVGGRLGTVLDVDGTRLRGASGSGASGSGSGSQCSSGRSDDGAAHGRELDAPVHARAGVHPDGPVPQERARWR
jgi:hypothetical protein